MDISETPDFSGNPSLAELEAFYEMTGKKSFEAAIAESDQAITNIEQILHANKAYLSDRIIDNTGL